MYESFYEPTENWSDNVGYNCDYSISIDERMAADPVTLEDFEESWKSYILDEEFATAQRPPRIATDPWVALTQYLFASGQIQFEVRLGDGSAWKGYLSELGEVCMTTYPILPTQESSFTYRGFENFFNPRKLVDHFLSVCDYLLLDDDEDPFNFIWTSGNNSKSWANIKRDIMNLE